MRGFGSDSIGMGGGRASPVVLVPTFFSNQEDEFDEGPTTGRMGAARKAGFVDIEDFYADDSRNRRDVEGESESETETESSEGSEEGESSEEEED